MALFVHLAGQSAGVGVGVFIGALLGLSMRARGGNRGGLFRGSVVATAFLAAAAAMGTMMLVQFLRMGA